MRRNLQILLTLALIFTVSVSFASTTGKEKKTDGQEQEQDGRRKSDQTMIRPDGESATVPIDQQQQDYQVQEDEKSESTSRARVNANQSIDKVDTLQDDSVSKYNFIFYFLYKFKYDAEEAP